MTITALSQLDPIRLDVRSVDCTDKRGLIFERWMSLAPGQHFVLVNSHDPIPMYYMLSGQFPEQLNWEYEERTPEYVAIRITKVGPGVVYKPFAPPMDAPTTCGHAAPDAAESREIEVDARGLEPPEPFRRILAALQSLAAGNSVRALTDRRPVHLLADLETRGFIVVSEVKPDGSWSTQIQRA